MSVIIPETLPVFSLNVKKHVRSGTIPILLETENQGGSVPSSRSYSYK